MSLAISYAFAAVSVFSIMVGQFFFKRTAELIGGKPLISAFTNVPALTSFLTAASIYAIATVFWVIALRQLPLSRAYMLNAFSFIVLPLVAHWLLSEPLSGRFVVGAIFISIGVILTNSA